MSQPRDIDVMRMYVADNLSQCCAEILEWQKTSVLRDGCVRTAAAMLTSCKPDELRVVECEVARAAMARVARPTSPEGPREGEHPDTIALSAWHRQFGTTQLSHAIARLEAAEKRADRAEAELAAMRSGEGAEALPDGCPETAAWSKQHGLTYPGSPSTRERFGMTEVEIHPVGTRAALRAARPAEGEVVEGLEHADLLEFCDKDPQCHDLDLNEKRIVTLASAYRSKAEECAALRENIRAEVERNSAPSPLQADNWLDGITLSRGGYEKDSPTRAEYQQLREFAVKAKAAFLERAEECERVRGLFRSLLNKVNVVTAHHRHGNPVPAASLDELSNRQIEVEEAARALTEKKGIPDA